MFTSTQGSNKKAVKTLCSCEWKRKLYEWDSNLSEFSKIVNEPNNSNSDATFWIDIFEIVTENTKDNVKFAT